MPRRRDVLDPRLYGIAPVEKEVVQERVYLTLAGLLNRLQISEDTFRRHHAALLRQRIPVTPTTYRWRVEDVDAYAESLKVAQQAKDAVVTEKVKRRIATKVADPRQGRTIREIAKLSPEFERALTNYRARRYHADGTAKDESAPVDGGAA